MNRVKLFLVFAAATAAVSSGVGAYRRQGAPPDSSPALRDLPALVDHLRAAGLRLRAVPTMRDGSLPEAISAYLTETDQGWEELALLLAAPEGLDGWRGTLLVERAEGPATREGRRAVWGDGCLFAGPFVVFGDPELLARARAALAPRVAAE